MDINPYYKHDLKTSISENVPIGSSQRAEGSHVKKIKTVFTNAHFLSNVMTAQYNQNCLAKSRSNLKNWVVHSRDC